MHENARILLAQLSKNRKNLAESYEAIAWISI